MAGMLLMVLIGFCIVQKSSVTSAITYNGLDWEYANNLPYNNIWGGITFGNGKFVASIAK